MTLADFFTLTEMNDGLAAPSRVRELMAVMEKERDCIKNAAVSTRQWSAVASAIVATEKKDCLDLFLQLDGLDFISKWLKEAHKFDDDRESITYLLRALEKLDVDHEKLLASGIWETVQNLLVHNNSKVQDKARALVERWKTKTDSTTSTPDVEKAGVLTVDKPRKSDDIERGRHHSESPPIDASICQENSVNTKGHEFDNPDLSTSSNAPELVESENNLDESSNLLVGDKESLNHVSSSSLQKSTVELSLCSPDNTTSEPCVAAVPSQDILNASREFHDSESSNSTKQPAKIESLSDKVESNETSKYRSHTSSSLVLKETVAIAAGSQTNSIVGGKESCNEGLSCIDSMEIDSDANAVKQKGDGSNQCKTPKAFIEGGITNHHMLSQSSNSEKILENPKDSGTFHTGSEDKGKVNTPDLRLSENNIANSYTFGEKSTDREPDRAGKKSDVELGYGIVEVAGQVAMEVEREVVDNKEPGLISSEKLPRGNVRQQSSAELSKTQSHSSEDSPKEMVNYTNASDESPPTQEKTATRSGHQDAEPTNSTQDMANSQVTEVAQEEANEEKGLCVFDLNQEDCSEDPDLAENQFFAPVSLASTSRAAAAAAAPVQFEGPSTGGSCSSSKQQEGCPGIDLNVTEDIDPGSGDLTADKHVQFIPTIPSGESSAETSSRRSEHLTMDLNYSSEDTEMQLDWRIGQLFPHTSMSSKHPTSSLNLNDQPTFLNDPPITQTFNVTGGIKDDDSVISIMGKKVEVSRREFVSQTPQLPNGRNPELPFDMNLGRTSDLLGIGSSPSYPHSSGYGYSVIAPTPPIPHPYGSGGPTPYMMDSRGQHLFPMVGSSSSLPNAYPQPPFALNLNTSNGIGSSRSSFDLDFGTLSESGSKDPSGFGLFLNSAQARSAAEQLRPESQPPISSVSSGKRKEPENGWEQYPFRNYTPPWKQS